MNLCTRQGHLQHGISVSTATKCRRVYCLTKTKSMGKSNKKVKSERINALRKQYDSFLEEDKKRRERNEFILDRLDKMRYCTATVPYRKPFVSSSRLQQHIAKTHDTEVHPTKEFHTFINRLNDVDDVAIQEICKKFILIPKVSTSNIQNVKLDDYTDAKNTTISDNSDWRVKYEILNQLKNTENEDLVSEKHATKYELPKVGGILMTQNRIDISKTESDSFSKDLPEKDVSNEKMTKNVNNYNNKPTEVVSNKIEHCISPEKTKGAAENYSCSEYTAEPPQNNTFVDDVNSKPQAFIAKEYLEYQDTNENHIQMDPQLFNDNQPMQNETDVERSEPLLNNIETSVQETVNIDQNKTPLLSEITNHTNSHTVENILSPNIESSAAAIASSESLEDRDKSLNENIYKEEITNNIENIDETSHLNQNNEQAEVTNTIEEQEVPANASTEQYEGTHTDDVSGIHAFNTEQNEMFYAEQPDPNYNYDQNYQGVEGEQYNEEYVQNQGYEQNEQYNYYEGDQQHVYQSDINEHEETMQRYDQNYEEQYAEYEQGDYNQQPEYQHLPQENQQYEGQAVQEHPQMYQETTEGYEHQGYENQTYESQELIEKKMDNDQEFVEKENVEDSESVNTTVEEKQVDEIKSTQQVM